MCEKKVVRVFFSPGTQFVPEAAVLYVGHWYADCPVLRGRSDPKDVHVSAKISGHRRGIWDPTSLEPREVGVLCRQCEARRARGKKIW